MGNTEDQRINKFLDLGISMKHVKNLPPINFAASENEMIATIQKTEGGQMFAAEP